MHSLRNMGDAPLDMIFPKDLLGVLDVSLIEELPTKAKTAVLQKQRLFLVSHQRKPVGTAQV